MGYYSNDRNTYHRQQKPQNAYVSPFYGEITYSDAATKKSQGGKYLSSAGTDEDSYLVDEYREQRKRRTKKKIRVPYMYILGVKVKVPGILWMIAVLLLGFVAYGLSINFYIKAQKDLGAAKTSAWYSIAPFLGVAFGILLLNERPGIQFYVGLVIMILATILMVKDTIGLQHTHEHSHVHIHEHRHGDLVHTHVHEHCHTHTHIHGEDESIHDHPYDADTSELHVHEHTV